MKHAYAKALNLQTKKGAPLAPHEFARQYVAAMREIDENKSLSFTFINERTGSETRDIYHIRCGRNLRGAFCFRKVGHDDDCDKTWEK